MGKHQYHGIITTDIVDVRFAFSGRIAWINKRTGDSVKKGDVIASLDRKFLQAELDRQLADYEKTRGAFEVFKIKNPSDNDDITKYSRQEVQATLNASVKEVEIAKFKLDQASLFSPVNGVITDIGGLATGLNVTGASNPVSVVDLDQLRFEFTIKQDDVSDFMKPQEATVHIGGVKKEVKGKTQVPFMGKNGVFTILVILEKHEGVMPGMTGLVHV